MLPHIFNGNGTISIMIDGKMKPIDTAHKNYEEIKEAIKVGDWDVVPGLVNIVEQVQNAINSGTAQGKVTVENGEVYYNGTRINNTLSNKIVSMAKEGFDIGFMVKFLENLMANPSFRAVNELYDFLASGNIPITENGTFLTYKKIQNNWTDIHSGKFDNSIGAVCEMPRNMVDEDSSRTCSAGLHVCSYDYLPHFSSSNDDRVVICEVNPADVVSIPADYNNTKMRVCKYTVIGEVEDYKESEILAKNAVVYTEDVTMGKTAGTINHTNTATNAKEIGKKVTEMLEDGEVECDKVVNAAKHAGLDGQDLSFLEEILEYNGDYKRAGKRIAKHIMNNDINAASFLTELEAGTIEEEYCDECGELIDDCICDQNDEDHVCERCGSTLDESTDECPSCGYWN
jgi:hypothetical protein